jgi:hypothetical protein
MTLAFHLRYFHQQRFFENGRAAQHGSCNRNLIRARKLPNQIARRVGDRSYSLGKVDTCRNFGVCNQIDQDVVEQIDMFRSKTVSPFHEQLGNPARHLGEAFGITPADNLFDLADQGVCNRHERTQPRPLAFKTK